MGALYPSLEKRLLVHYVATPDGSVLLPAPVPLFKIAGCARDHLYAQDVITMIALCRPL
jgi:hypothetical protein